MGVLQPGLSGSDLLVSILGAYHWGCFILYSLKKCGQGNDISFVFQGQFWQHQLWAIGQRPWVGETTESVLFITLHQGGMLAFSYTHWAKRLSNYFCKYNSVTSLSFWISLQGIITQCRLLILSILWGSSLSLSCCEGRYKKLVDFQVVKNG